MHRYETVKGLAQYLALPYQLSKEDEFLERKSSLPTIGIEIEVPWRTLIPHHSSWFDKETYAEFSLEKKKAFQELCSRIEEQEKPKYKATLPFIPKGYDKFYEFAHKPVQWYKTLSEEVRLLMDAELIKEHHCNPMHLTVSDLQKGKDAGLVAFLVELLGGTTPDRLQSSYNKPNGYGWQCKGRDSGLRERKKEDVQLNKESAIEISTLCATFPQQVEQTLHNAQLLAWAAISHRHNQKLYQSQVWKNITSQIDLQILIPHQLNQWWKNPSDNQQEWETYCSLFSNAHVQEIKEQIQKNLYNLSQYYKEDFLVKENNSV